jgi:hypothetical protein
MASLSLPEPFASIPRENFLFGPSPIQELPRISAALGGKVNVYAKREDCNSGLAYGGNKVRKLECVTNSSPNSSSSIANFQPTGTSLLRPRPRAPTPSSPSAASSPTTPAP